METLKTKTLVYDSNCPMCNWYTRKMVQAGVIDESNLIAFEQLDHDGMCKLNFNQARHEIPMVDNSTGKIIYGADALAIVFANAYPAIKPLITATWFKTLLRPLYHFISYNRRIIAGGAPEAKDTLSFAPDFDLGWRIVLIITGFGYTALCIYIFALLTALSPLLLLSCVTGYFLLLLIFDLANNNSFKERINYLGHLAVLGFVEGSIFVFTALLGKVTGLNGLMFAGQGAGRLLAIWLHAERVKNNHYHKSLNYAFAAGAIALVVLIAVFKN